MVRRLLAISPTIAYWGMILALVGFSLYFATHVESRRRLWKPPAEQVKLRDGETVRLLGVIDGDEVSVATPAGGSVVVRLLGVKAFKAGVNEPDIGPEGKAAVRMLERLLEREPLTVRYTKLKQDRAGRLIAYLHAGGRDVGLALVKEGRAVVYTRYPFSRQARYLAAELEARTRSRGLWASPPAALRATAWKAAWEAQRSDD